MSPELIASAASLAAVAVLTLVNFRQGWSKASTDYVTTLKGLVDVREREIADLRAENQELASEIRRLERRVRLLEDAGFGK